MKVSFVEVSKEESIAGTELYAFETHMTLDAFPHIPRIGETVMLPGEKASERRRVVNIIHRWTKKGHNVVVAMMKVKAT